MAVTAGVDKPTVAQYNSVQSTINTVLASRYGQTLASSQLASPGTSTKITVSDWANLRSDILKANRHQLNPAAVGTLTNPTTSTKIAAADFNAYETMANACLTNYLLFPDNSTISSTLQIANLSWIPGSGAWGLSGRNTLIMTIMLDMAGGTDIQTTKYFDAGAQLRFDATFTGGTVATPGTKDYSWKSAVNEMGTIIFGRNSTRTLAGATGAGTGSSIGYAQLTTAWQLIFTKATSTYTPNVITIHAKKIGLVLYFAVQYQDQNDRAGTYTIDEDVSASVNTYVTAYYGSGAGEVDNSADKPTLRTGSGGFVQNGANP
jgi:hypothetical protein